MEYHPAVALRVCPCSYFNIGQLNITLIRYNEVSSFMMGSNSSLLNCINGFT